MLKSSAAWPLAVWPEPGRLGNHAVSRFGGCNRHAALQQGIFRPGLPAGTLRRRLSGGLPS
jgi:hypothetical protein